MWGRWSESTLPDLLPRYLEYLPMIKTASDNRSRRYCEHLSSIAVFGLIDPIESEWLDSFILQAGPRERLNWASSLTQLLRDGDEQMKESTWSRWLRKYWQKRIESSPLPIAPEEAGEMAILTLVLKSHFAEAVELVRSGTPPTFGRRMFYYQLSDAKISSEHPVATARLLAFALRKEDGKDFWDIDQVHEVVDELIRTVPAEPTLLEICEQLARVGSPRALEFRSRLEKPKNETS
jgi:hypothetical protein